MFKLDSQTKQLVTFLFSFNKEPQQIMAKKESKKQFMKSCGHLRRRNIIPKCRKYSTWPLIWMKILVDIFWIWKVELRFACATGLGGGLCTHHADTANEHKKVQLTKRKKRGNCLSWLVLGLTDITVPSFAFFPAGVGAWLFGAVQTILIWPPFFGPPEEQQTRQLIKWRTNSISEHWALHSYCHSG